VQLLHFVPVPKMSPFLFGLQSDFGTIPYVNRKRAPYLFENDVVKCWPNFTMFGRQVAKKCRIFVLCCQPRLFSVDTLPQEKKVPFNYACMCKSVLLTAVIWLLIQKVSLQAKQNHNAYRYNKFLNHLFLSERYITVIARRG